jgi:hypothetical protein
MCAVLEAVGGRSDRQSGLLWLRDRRLVACGLALWDLGLWGAGLAIATIGT